MPASFASQLRRSSAIFLLALLAACGGGSGGGSASPPAGGGGTPTPPSAPLITAAIATFPAEGLPSSFYGRGHATLAVVAVTAAGSGEPISSATVTVNGTVLPYIAELKAYRTLIDLDQEQSVTLNVTSDAVLYSAEGRQAPTFPALMSPPARSGLFEPSRNDIDLDRSQATPVSWTGKLPGPEYRYAVGVLDPKHDLAWPQRAAFQIIAAGAPAEAILPAGVVPDGFPSIMAGITRSFAIARAASGSSLAVGNFSQSMVNSIGATSSTLASLQITPPKLLTLATQWEIRLVATGTYADYRNSQQDLSARVSWSSDAPGVATVSATGLLTGIAPGSANLTARMGAISVTRAVTVLARQSASAPGDAVAFQVDAGHSGHATFGQPFVMPAAPTWAVDLPGPISYPLIANGKVFVLSTRPWDGHSTDVSLYAFDAQTGQAAWGPVVVEATQPWAGLTFDRNKVIVMNAHGVLMAFDAGTGKRSWSLPLGELVPNIWQFASSPTASNGLAYVLGSGVGSTLCAVDVDTGALMWTSDYLSASGGGAVAISDTSAYVSGYLQYYALDRFSGASIWRSSGPGSGGGSRTPALFQGKLYIRDAVAPFTLTLDQLTGARSGPVGAAVGATKGVDAYTRIAAFGGDRKFELTQGTLAAIDLVTRQVAWEFVGDGDLISVPIMIDQTVFVGSRTGMVFGIDALTGHELWRARAGAAIDWTDEFNASQPLTGMGAGGGLLVVPAGHVLSVFRLQKK